MADCSNCGHQGCDGGECQGEFVLTLPDGRLKTDCAICCREILAGESHYREELVRVAAVFAVQAALTL
jgi:hypothetical protein